MGEHSLPKIRTPLKTHILSVLGLIFFIIALGFIFIRPSIVFNLVEGGYTLYSIFAFFAFCLGLVGLMYAFVVELKEMRNNNK